MLALFHDKKCCNCFNFVSCILWDFIVLGIVLSWWRIEHELKNKWILREANLRKSHVKSIWWKLKSHVRLSISQMSRRKGFPARYPWNSLPRGFLSVSFLPFTHTIYTLITHKSMRGHSERKTLDRFSTTQTPVCRERATHS